MTAPQIQRYIDFLSHDTFGNTTLIYDEVTCHNIDQIFAVLARLEPNRMDGYDLWLKIPRGTIEDYGDYQEWLEVGDVENYAEFEAMWRSDYPDEFVWYNFKVSLQRHNHKSQQKPSQPTLKRRCFFVKSDVFLWPGFGKEWC